MGVITLRNIVDLKRNIDNTFKNEPNYKIKRAKLESLDKKRDDISSFIQRIEQLLDKEEKTFFTIALDDDLIQIIHLLKVQLNECRHNIIAAQKQIIEYLNQILYQSRVVEKVRQLKYLKDQFTSATTPISISCSRQTGISCMRQDPLIRSSFRWIIWVVTKLSTAYEKCTAAAY